MEIVDNRTQFIDLEYLNTTCSGDQSMIQVIMKMFVDKTPELIVRLNKAVSNGDWENVHAIAHKLKSSFLTFGSKRLGGKLETIEVMTSEERLDSSENSFGELVKLMSDVNTLSQGAIEELNKVLFVLQNKN